MKFEIFKKSFGPIIESSYCMPFGIEKLTLLRKKCNWKVLVLTKLSNAGTLEYALQDAPKSTFYGTMGLIQS